MKNDRVYQRDPDADKHGRMVLGEAYCPLCGALIRAPGWAASECECIAEGRRINQLAAEREAQKAKENGDVGKR